MKFKHYISVLVLGITLFVGACAAPVTVPAMPIAQVAATNAAARSTTPAPTSTSIPPTATNTAVPPTATNTPVPPTLTNTYTATPTRTPTKMNTPTNVPTTIASTAVPAPTVQEASAMGISSDVLYDALTNNQNLKSYRGDSVQQIDDQAPGIWKGDVRVPDVHYVYSEGTEQREMITVGNEYYLKNNDQPTEWFLIPESEHRRYIVQAPRPGISQIAGFVGDFSDAEKAILSSYRKTGAVPMDGLQCDVYAQDKRAAAATFLNIWTQKNHLLPPSDEAAALFDQAEIKVWLCADGYLHQAEMTLKPMSSDSAFGFRLLHVTMHIYDLDADIQIAAPTNLKPFPSPPP